MQTWALFTFEQFIPDLIKLGYNVAIEVRMEVSEKFPLIARSLDYKISWGTQTIEQHLSPLRLEAPSLAIVRWFKDAVIDSVTDRSIEPQPSLTTFSALTSKTPQTSVCYKTMTDIQLHQL